MNQERILPGFFCLALALASLTSGASCPAFAGEAEPVVHVGGDVPKPGDWSAAQVRKELESEVKPLQYAGHGQQHESNCVPLISLLKAAGVATELKMGPGAAGPKTKHQELRLIVVVQGSDGYTVCFSLAEMMSDVGNRPVWLALDLDGKPLPIPGEGPMKLIVPDDKKPARAVHSIQTITVVNPKAATTQPVQ
jgi:DMSO/TMAO reductase YedYZ molybdopterin-dependent catalytic subunit